jgi:hypothetical protein
MEDKKYPGFDVNPIFPVYEYLNLTTTLKLCEAGFGSFIKLQSTPLDLIKLQASLSESECQEVEALLLLVRNTEK